MNQHQALEKQLKEFNSRVSLEERLEAMNTLLNMAFAGCPESRVRIRNEAARLCAVDSRSYELDFIYHYSFLFPRKAHELLKEKDFRAYPYSFLEDAAWTGALRHFRDSLYETEINGIQERFKERHLELIPGSELVEVKPLENNRPDFFLRVNGKICPVEIKKEAATSQAVKQILRYIEAYQAESGYLVAPSLKVPLPSNILFVELE